MLSVAIFIAIQNESMAASIPKQFQGKWSTASDCKLSNTKESGWVQGSEERVSIGPRSIEWLESGCNLSKIIQSSPTSFKATYNCSGEGGESHETHSLQLNNGRLMGGGLVDRVKVQVKCR